MKCTCEAKRAHTVTNVYICIIHKSLILFNVAECLEEEEEKEEEEEEEEEG
jgi:hypothetical protein